MSWADVESAAAAGSLDETHWVELKEAVPPTSKPANLELARDLASLGADGGLLIVGIQDANGKAGKVVGTDDLLALRDRIDQVARSTVHPPLAVSSSSILDPSDVSKGRGCLIVSVPASPDAPHMVDKHYWGRGDTGKVRLDDSQVQRYFEARRLRREEAAGKLHEWTRSPSVRENTTDEGRLYVTIAARGGLPDQFTQLLYRGDGALAQAIQRAANAVGSTSYISTPISLATNYYRGKHSEGYTSDLSNASVDEGSLVIVEAQEDGTVNVIQGRVTARADSSGRVISIPMVQEVVHQALMLAVDLGAQAGYYGQWNVGISITNMKGAADSRRRTFGGVTNAFWREDDYEQITMVTESELTARTGHIVYRLLLPLARTLRIDSELAARLGVSAQAPK
jgi:hypothetical protein